MADRAPAPYAHPPRSLQLHRNRRHKDATVEKMQEAEKFMINGQGHHVPVSMVKPEDKLENDVVLE